MFRKLLWTGILVAAMAWSQEGMGGMGGGRQRGGGEMGGAGGMGGGMPRPQRLSRADQVAEKLKLNKEQKEQLQEIFSAAREKAGPIRDQMDKQRAQIAGAMIDGKTGDEIQKLLTDYSGLAAQMTSVETEAYGKIYAMLKPNQQGKAGQAFELMAGIFSAPSGRGGQGRGRGGAR